MSTTLHRNTTLDLAKYIASLLIVGIHTNLGAEVHENLRFVIVEIVCRLAVPFFAVSTGYFLEAKLTWDRENWRENRILLWKQEKKQIRLYVIWTVLYLFFSIPSWIQTGWFSPWAFVDYAIGAVKDGSYYHLWYILSLIFALPILYILLRALKKNFFMLLSIGLYMIMLLFYSYNWILPDSGDRLFSLLSYSFATTAALFMMVPMLLLGIKIGNSRVLPIKKAIAGLIISFLLLSAEAFWLRVCGCTKYSYIVFTYPTVYFLFQVLLNLKTERKLFTQLARISIFIYCFHPMIIETLNKLVYNSVLLFLITALIAGITGYGWLEFKKKMERKGLCFH